MRTTKLYEVRYFKGNGFSQIVGFKMRLLERGRASRVVGFLMRHGIDAVALPLAVG